MPPSTAKIKEKLERFTAGRELVQITRRLKGADRLEGFLVGRGERWVLLHLVTPHGFSLDGYVALRAVDIKSCKPWGAKNGSFPSRCLQYFGEIPVVPQGIDLSRTHRLIVSAAARWPLLTLFVEADDPEVCFVGQPVSVSSRHLRLLPISPAAEWQEEPIRFDLRDVTRIQFGGRYEEALYALGRRSDDTTAPPQSPVRSS
jgi:hypothetical protein